MIRACLLGGHSRPPFDYEAYFNAAKTLLSAGQIQIVHRGPRGLSEAALKNAELWLVWPDFGLGNEAIPRPGYVVTLSRLKALAKYKVAQLPFEFDELDLQDRLDPVLRSMGLSRSAVAINTKTHDSNELDPRDLERIAFSMLVQSPWLGNEEGGEILQAEHGVIAYKGARALRVARDLLGIQRKVVRGGIIRVVIDLDKFNRETGLTRFDPKRLPEKVKLSCLNQGEAISPPPVPVRRQGTRNKTADIRPSDMTGIRPAR